MSIAIGLDIGGTKLMAAAADDAGRLLRRTRAPTPLDLEEGLDLLHRMIVEVAQGEPVAAIGEYALGGVPASRLLYLTLSTGMGGGFVVDGAIYRGAQGGHPEVGHQSVHFRCAHPERVACECGAPDCLEALVSGNAIRRIYGKPAEQLAAEEWDELAYNLGQGLRNLATIYLPDVIVLGGGVALGGGERLIAAAREVIRDHLRLVAAPELRLSRLGYDTALLGSVVLARTSAEF